MSDYRIYRRAHLGPLSQKSFNFWKRNGGNDLQSFKWKKEKEIKKRQKEKYHKSPTTKKNLQNIKKRNQKHEWTCSLPLIFFLLL